jgi:hypothetical protein
MLPAPLLTLTIRPHSAATHAGRDRLRYRPSPEQVGLKDAPEAREIG